MIDLSHLWTVIRCSGADARAFLHSQLTTDVNALGEHQAQLSAYLTPKGRVIALVVLVPSGDDWLILANPTLADALLRRLRMFVLRASVTMAIDPDLRVYGRFQADDPTPSANPLPLRQDGSPEFGWPDNRTMGITDAGRDDSDECAERDRWLIADVRAGIPHVTEATSDRHVAQMLGLERLAALSLKKGCYPGQEVVARAHYLGRVKRQLVRLSLAEPLAPGAAVHADDQVVGHLVFTTDGSAGPPEGLAVLNESAADRPLVDAEGRPCEPHSLA